MTMKMNYNDHINNLKEKFTEEAFSLLQGFLNELIDLLQRKIPKSIVDETLQGIFTYIYEFADDKGISMNYNLTLELLQDLGSPSAIVQSLGITFDDVELEDEYPVAVDKGKICSHCKWVNIPTDSHCQSCGRKLKIENIENGGFVQYGKDHPYAIGFLLSYLTILITVPPILSSLDFFDSGIDNYTVLIYSLVIFYGLIPALILGLFIGMLIDYKFRNQKSFKAYYNKAIEEISGNLLGIVFLLYLHLGFLYVSMEWAFPSNDDHFNTLITAYQLLSFSSMFFIIPLFLIIHEYHKPKKLKYITILNLKSQANNAYKQKLLRYNYVFIATALISSLLWLITQNPYYHSINARIEEHSIFVFVNVLILLNILYAVYHYNWIKIMRDFKK